MNEYKCYRCGYETNRKDNIIRHLSRKKICKAKLEDITLDEVKLMNSIELIPSKSPNLVQNNFGIVQNNSNKSLKKNKCEYCEREFNNKSNLNKHLKRSCKVKNDKEKKIEEEVLFLKEELKKKEEESKKEKDYFSK